jgi:flagellar hook-associated protein 3 FlgL
MRVTNTMMTNNLMRNLNKNLSRMEKLQQQMASGKKFTRPSDDPIGVSRSLRLHTEVANMEQYKRNAEDAQSWMETTEIAVGNIVDILQRANELAVQAATETNSIDERRSIAGEITELRNQLIQIGNTTYAGSYVFSGFKTDKPLLTSEGKYDIGEAGAKLTLYEIIETNIGLGDRMGMNSVGQRLFGLYTSAADLDTATADTLKQKQSLKGNFLNVSAANPIDTSGDKTFNMSYNGGTPVELTINGSYTSVADLAAAINVAITTAGVPLAGNVTASAVDNKLVFESNAELTIQESPGPDNLDLALIGMSNNQTSVSRVDKGDSSQLITVFDKLISDLTEAPDGNTAGINDAIARIQAQSSNINAIRAEIGVKSNRIDLTVNRILDDTLNLEGLLSKNEDADMAEVIMRVMMEENVYQASLSTGARIIQPTLIDFLN